MSSSTGSIETIAGTGEAGYRGDGGQATAADLDQPFHCDLDREGNLYFAEGWQPLRAEAGAADGRRHYRRRLRPGGVHGR